MIEGSFSESFLINDSLFSKTNFSGNFICDGIVYVAGVMIGYWADDFEANLATVAFIGSIMNGIAFGNGPIVACLIKKFGCRAGKYFS